VEGFVKIEAMTDQPKFYFTPVLIMMAALITACGSVNDQAVVNAPVNNKSQTSRNMNESTAQNVEVRTDLEGLEKQINLPVRPSEVKWTAEFFDNSKGAVPGPDDYRLTVLLKYDDRGAAELIKILEAPAPEKSTGNTDVKAWFPDEVKSEAKTIDGRTYLEGAKYLPGGFVRAPYQNGNLIRVGTTNYFVLNLFSF
jgi:hypothetical protein